MKSVRFKDYSKKQKKFVKERGLPEEIKLRLVKVELENGEIEVLMTSLIGRRRNTKQKISSGYKRR